MTCPRIRSPRFAVSLLALLAGGAFAQSARPGSDLQPPGRRAANVELATRLATAREPAKLPARAINPFNPQSWDAPDPEELRLQAAAAEAARRAGLTAVRATTPLQLLEAVAGELRVTGVVSIGGEPILLVGSRKIRVGDPITATHDGRALTVTVTAIDRTSFTLRLNGEEFTRSIKSGTKP